MTDYAELCERLKAAGERFWIGTPEEHEALYIKAAAAIERLSDSNEGLTEDLYQAVLVAYRRGAHEWARLNYPQWIDAIVVGQEVAPIARTALQQETQK